MRWGVLLVAILFCNSAYSQNPSGDKSYSVKKCFMHLGEYPIIHDSAAFIADLKSCGKLQTDADVELSGEEISYFAKLKIFGSALDFYLIEYNWQRGCNAAFPWKYQVIFNSNGELVAVLSGIRFEVVSVIRDQHPFLLFAFSTAHGNGYHKLFRIKRDSLVNTLVHNGDLCAPTYDACEDEAVNNPSELAFNIKDINNDGHNDIVFTGSIDLIRAVSKKGVWYDGENIDGKTIAFSTQNPFRRIPVSVSFVYDKHSGQFVLSGNYNKYCTDNVYKLIYK